MTAAKLAAPRTKPSAPTTRSAKPKKRESKNTKPIGTETKGGLLRLVNRSLVDLAMRGLLTY